MMVQVRAPKDIRISVLGKLRRILRAKYSRFGDNYRSVDEVASALSHAGLEVVLMSPRATSGQLQHHQDERV
ncbi:hypothetical protein Bca52824_023817 [Brassica carinata]|uniref:Uncharacterized protein n=1 Tax=Brassica carinata TaxID=52824 RepID=A0A8X7VJ13_BRACI|nr:hypothetical protein Bca52824_023817 [Brassica carinata]